MAEKIQLEIEITLDGEVRIKTEGLKGVSCTDETEALEKALGRVAQRKKTSEYYEVVKGSQGTTKQK